MANYTIPEEAKKQLMEQYTAFIMDNNNRTNLINSWRWIEDISPLPASLDDVSKIVIHGFLSGVQFALNTINLECMKEDDN